MASFRQASAPSFFRTRREPIPGGSDETSLFHTVPKKAEHSPGLPILTLTVESLWFQVMLLPGRLKLGWVFTLGTVCFREETSEPPGMGSWRVPGVNTHPGDPIWNKWDSSVPGPFLLPCSLTLFAPSAKRSCFSAA